MRNQLVKFLVILTLGLVGLQFGLNHAVAGPPEGKGKNSNPIGVPPGIFNKLTPGAGGTYSYNGSHIPTKFQNAVDAYNASLDPGCVSGTCSQPTVGVVADVGGTLVTICPTSLSPEEMRICLGQPKPQRVKKLLVKLNGQAAN